MLNSLMKKCFGRQWKKKSMGYLCIAVSVMLYVVVLGVGIGDGTEWHIALGEAAESAEVMPVETQAIAVATATAATSETERRMTEEVSSGETTPETTVAMSAAPVEEENDEKSLPIIMSGNEVGIEQIAETERESTTPVTLESSIAPTEEITIEDAVDPTAELTIEVTVEPTAEPMIEATVEPTVEPTIEVTVEPTAEPTIEATVEPTAEPTIEVTVEPTAEPTIEVTVEPTAEPTVEATVAPTVEASVEPMVEPNVENGAALMMAQAMPVTEAMPAALATEDETDETVTTVADEDAEYGLTAGSAQVFINNIRLNALHMNTVSGNAISNALLAAANEAANHIQSASERIVVRVVVGEGSYSGGLSMTDESTGKTLMQQIKERLEEKFLDYTPNESDDPDVRFEIAAEDAIYDSDDSAPYYDANGSGNAILDGDVNFDGYNVLMAGLKFATHGKISVANADTFEYYGTQQDDDVTIEATNIQDSVAIDLGDGDDQLDLTIHQNATTVEEVGADVVEKLEDLVLDDDLPSLEEIRENPEKAVGDLGEAAKNAADEVIQNATKQKKLNVTVQGGTGSDTINVKTVNSTAIDIEPFDVNDPASLLDVLTSFQLDTSRTDLSIDGGDGNDCITVKGGMDLSFGRVLINAVVDYISQADLSEEELLERMSTTRISGGSGDDVISVDTTHAFANFFGVDVEVDGDIGFDRLHLTGKLNSNEENRLSGDRDGIDMKALAELSFGQFRANGESVFEGIALPFAKDFKISVLDTEAFTDALQNKKTQSVTGSFTPAAFTDYIVAPIDGTVRFDGNPVGDAFLANILVSSNDTLKVEQLLGGSVNVRIAAPQIEVTGKVTGLNILLNAEQNDVLVGVEFGAVEDDLSEEKNLGFSFGLSDAKTETKITLTESAELIADETVELLAKTEMTSPYLYLNIEGDKLADILDTEEGNQLDNFFVVKLGSAQIDIRGKVMAMGSIAAKAMTEIAIDASDELFEKIPMAVAAASGTAKVNVQGNAEVYAGYAVDMSASNRISVSAQDTAAFPKVDVSIVTAVTVADTEALIKDQASVLSGTGLRLKAETTVDSLAASAAAAREDGKKINVVQLKSGVYIGLTASALTTRAAIEGAANVMVKDGNVEVLARSNARYGNLALSTSTESGESGASASLDVSNQLIQKILSTANTMSGNFLPNQLAELLGSDSAIVEKVREMLSGSGDVKTQFAGALAVHYVDNASSAAISTTGSVFGVDVIVDSWMQSAIENRADGSLNSSAGIGGTSASTSAGVAVAVGITDATNEAIVENADISARTLNILANAGELTSLTSARSGMIPSDSKIGIAGAIGVQTVSVKQQARLKNTAKVALDGGNLELSAVGGGSFSVVGDASGKRKAKEFKVGSLKLPLNQLSGINANSTGVGAGIAVGVLGIDADAIVEDGAQLSYNNYGLEGIWLKAGFAAKEEINSAAGSAGGTSVSPVVSTTVSGVGSKAYFGKTDEEIFAYYMVSICSDVEVERTLSANAAVAGNKAGVGGAFAVAVVNDSADAQLETDVAGTFDVEVAASSISRMTQRVLASSAGAAAAASSGEGTQTASKADADQVVNGTVQPSGTMTNGSQQTVDQQIDQHMAGSVKVAGATGSSKLDASKILSLLSSRQMAQTSEGSVTAAAAMALNIQANESHARVGDGLMITAENDVRVSALNDTDAVIVANASSTNSNTGVGVGVAINIVNDRNIAEVGTSQITAFSLTVEADIVEKQAAQTLEQAIRDLLNYLCATGKMEELINAALAEKGTSLDAEILQNIDTSGMTDDEKTAAYEAVRAQIVDDMTALLTSGKALDTASSLYGAFIEEFVEDMKEILSDKDFWIGRLLGDDENPVNDTLESFAHTMGTTADSMRTLLAMYLSEKFGGEDELEGVGYLISTQAISGVGAANVGVAGSVAITVIDGETRAEIASYEGSTEELEAINIFNKMELKANSVRKVYTTASASSALNLSKALKNRAANQTGTSVGVGASFSMNSIHTDAKALLGDNRDVMAGSLDVAAMMQNDVDSVSVAGSDPIARRDAAKESAAKLGEQEQKNVSASNSTGVKDISADASVAISLVDQNVYAKIGQGVSLYTEGDNIIADVQDPNKRYNLRVYASEKGNSYTAGSAFATGNRCAVGGTVALNLASSDVLASFEGIGVVAGDAQISTYTYNEDETSAYAVVTGASLDRYLEKLRSGLNFASVGYSDVSNTNATIMSKVNALVGSADGKTSPSTESKTSSMSLSQTLLQKLNIQQPDGSKKAEDGLKESDKLTDTSTQLGNRTENNGQKINVAAAVAVNITEHVGRAAIEGELTTSGNAMVGSENHANFRTLGTGATVTGTADVNSNNISTGVAVTVNQNRAETELNGKLIASEDVTLRSELRQNQDGSYAGLLSAQALGGSIGFSSGKVSIAGAVAVQTAKATAKTLVAEGATLTGANLTIEALDKSKIAVRAGGVTTGKQTVGVGASFALVYAQNETTATIGQNAKVDGASLTLRAERLKVSETDNTLPVGLDKLITADATEDRSKGLVNLHTGKNGKSAVELTLSSDDLLTAFDLMNYLASVNYYVESIAGNILVNAENPPTAAVAGSVSMLFAENKAYATIESGASVTLTGDLALRAASDNNARVIGGAMTASNGKVGVGASIATLDDCDDVRASVAGKIEKVDNAAIEACSSMDAWMITTADAITAGSSSGATVGGGINVVNAASQTVASVAEGAGVTANGNFALLAKSDRALVEAALDVAAKLGTGSGAAVGGTVAVIVSKAETLAEVGKNVKITAENISVKADSDETLYVLLASVSAQTAASGANVAGTISTLVTSAKTEAAAREGAVLEAKTDAAVLANAAAKEVTIAAAAVVSNAQAAVGGAVNTSVLNQSVQALVGEKAQLLALSGDATVQANGDMHSFMVTVAGSAGTNTGNVSGTVSTLVSKVEVNATEGKQAKVEAGSKNKAKIAASLKLRVDSVAGAVAATTGTVSVGATVNTVVVKNQLAAQVGELATLKGENASVTALNDEDVLAASVSGAASANVSVGGVVNTAVFSSSTTAEMGENATADASMLQIDAKQMTDVYNFAGAISASGGAAGVGATVNVLVYDNDVKAQTGNGFTYNGGGFDLNASSENQLYSFSAGFGASSTAGVAGGASTIVAQNRTHAIVDGTLTLSSKEKMTIGAKSDLNATLAAGGSGNGATAGISGEIGVCVLKNETLARIADGAKVTVANGGWLSMSSDSNETIDMIVVGASGAGTVGVAGSVGVTVSKVKTTAEIGSDATVQTGTGVDGIGLEITASNKMQYDGVVGAAGIAGAAGVGAGVQVNAAFNTVGVSVASGAKLISKDGVRIAASSDRDVKAYSIAGGVSGTAGVGGSVLVNVNGARMSRDAYDAMTKSEVKVDASLTKMFDSADGAASKYNPANGDDGILADLSSADYSLEAAVGDASEVDSKQVAQGSSSTAQNLVSEVDYKQNLSYEDAVSASIAAGALVQGTSVSISALDEYNADLISGAVGGGTAGVGATVSVAVLNQSAVAEIAKGASVIATDGDVTVKAGVGSAEIARDSSMDSYLTGAQKIAELANTSVRVINIACGAGVNGNAVSISAIVNTAEAHAIVAGKVQGTEMLNVAAHNRFGTVASLNGSLGAGVVGVGVSASVVVNQTVTETAVHSGADVQNFKTVNLNTEGSSDAVAMAMGIGAGAVGVNANVAAVINEARSDTYFAGNAEGSALNLSTNFTTDSTAAIYGTADGAIAVSTSAAVSVNRAVILTYLGAQPEISSAVKPDYVADVQGKAFELGNVKILNKVSGDSNATALSFGAGAIAVNGSVAVARQETMGAAAVYDAGLELGKDSLSVIALLDGSARADISGDSAGAIGAGIGVAVAISDADNRAVVFLTGASSGEKLEVFTEDESLSSKFTSNATAEIITGAAGKIAGGVNVAVAEQQAENLAQLTARVGFDFGNVQVHAKGVAAANAKVIGVTAGAAKIAASTAISNNSMQQQALVRLEGSDAKADAMTIQSELNGVSTSAAKAEVLAGSGSLIAADAHTAVACADSVNRVQLVSTGKFILSGDLVLNTSGRACAVANISKCGTDVVSVGLMIGSAEANAVFEAIADGNVCQTAGDTTLMNDYTVSAQSDVIPAGGGLNADFSKASVKSNMAKAVVGAEATTQVKGQWTLDGSLNLSTQGMAEAVANVEGVKVSVSETEIAVNEATAHIAASQTTSINNANITADSVQLRSSLNDSRSNPVGAEATAGSNGGANVSILSGKINRVSAQTSAQVTTQIADSSLTVTNGVCIDQGSEETSAADGTKKVHYNTSRAHASATTGSTIALLNAALMNVEAKADDSYTVEVELAQGNVISAKYLQLNNKNIVDVSAVTGQAGGLEASLADAECNIADASASVKNHVILVNNGKLNVSGSASLRGTTPLIQVSAQGNTAQVTISGLKVTVNAVKSTVQLDNQAYFKHCGEEAHFGSLNIESTANYTGDLNVSDDSRGASSSVGGSVGVTPDELENETYSVSLVGAKVNQAEAFSNSNVAAWLEGMGEIQIEKALSILASHNGRAEASSKTSGLEISLATVGGFSVKANDTSSAKAYIAGVTLSDDSVAEMSISAGSVSVQAKNQATAAAETQVPGGLAIISGIDAEVKASVGEAAKKQLSSAAIGENVTVTAQSGDISILATNEAAVGAGFSRNKNIQLVDVSTANAETYVYMDTVASIGEGAKLTANQNVTLSASDFAKGIAAASSDSTGILASGSGLLARNNVFSEVTAQVGAGASISGRKGVSILSASDAELSSEASAAEKSIFVTKGEIRSENLVSRNVYAKVEDGASIESLIGPIAIQAAAGLKDNIQTLTGIYSSALADAGSMQAHTKIDTVAKVEVGAGAKLISEFSKISLEAITASANLMTKAVSFINTTIEDALSDALTDLSFEGKVLVNDGGIERTQIKGNVVYLLSSNGSSNLESDSMLYASTFSGKTVKNVMNMKLTHGVKVGAADILAYDRLLAAAAESLKFDSNGDFADVNCSGMALKMVSELYRLSGSNAFSKAKIQNTVQNAGSESTVHITGNAWITARRVHLYSSDQAGSTYVIDKANYVSGNDKWNIESAEYSSSNAYASYTRKSDVDAKARFTMGAGATGAKALFYYDDNGAYRCLVTGKSRSIWRADAYQYVDGTLIPIVIESISNRNGETYGIVPSSENFGEWSIENGTKAGIFEWYDSLTCYEIINETDLDAVIEYALDFSAEKLETAPMVAGVRLTKSELQSNDDPELIIRMNHGGDVHINNLLNNMYGTTTIVWENEKGDLVGIYSAMDGSQTASLWTRHLTVKNAKMIGSGQAENSHLQVYMQADSGRSNVIIDAESLYITLTPVDIIVVADRTALNKLNLSTEKLKGAINLEKVIAFSVADVRLGTPYRIAYVQDGSAQLKATVLPGSLTYVDAANSGFTNESLWYRELYENVTIPNVDYYMTSYDPIALTFEYTFPNMYKVLTDYNGKVISVTTKDGIVIEIPGYETPEDYDPNVYYSQYDITLNLDTGEVTLGKNAKEYQVRLNQLKNPSVTLKVPIDWGGKLLTCELQPVSFATFVCSLQMTNDLRSYLQLYQLKLDKTDLRNVYVLLAVDYEDAITDETYGYQQAINDGKDWYVTYVFGGAYIENNEWKYFVAKDLGDGDTVVSNAKGHTVTAVDPEAGFYELCNGIKIGTHLTIQLQGTSKGMAISEGRGRDQRSNLVYVTPGSKFTLGADENDEYDLSVLCELDGTALDLEKINRYDRMNTNAGYQNIYYYGEDDVYINVFTGEVTLGKNAEGKYSVSVDRLKNGITGFHVDVYVYLSDTDQRIVRLPLFMDWSNPLELDGSGVSGWKVDGLSVTEATTFYAGTFDLSAITDEDVLEVLKEKLSDVSLILKYQYRTENGVVVRDCYDENVYGVFLNGTAYMQSVTTHLYRDGQWTLDFSDGSYKVRSNYKYPSSYTYFVTDESLYDQIGTGKEKQKYESPRTWGLTDYGCESELGKTGVKILTELYMETEGGAINRAEVSNGLNQVSFDAGDRFYLKRSEDGNVNLNFTLNAQKISLTVGLTDGTIRSYANGMYYNQETGEMRFGDVMSILTKDLTEKGAVTLSKNQLVRLEYVANNVYKVVSNDIFGAAETEHINPEWESTVSYTWFVRFSDENMYGYSAAKVLKAFFEAYNENFETVRENQVFKILNYNYEVNDDALDTYKIEWLKIYTENGVTYYEGFDGCRIGSDGSAEGPIGVQYEGDGYYIGSDGSEWDSSGKLVKEADKKLNDYSKRVSLGDTEYYVSYLEGEYVRISINDANAELLDGDLENDNCDIKATALRYRMPQTVIVGTNANPIEINCANILYMTSDGTEIDAPHIDFVLYIEDGDYTIDGDLIRKLGTYRVSVINGSLTINGDIIASRGAKVELYAKKNLTLNMLYARNAETMVELTSEEGFLQFKGAEITDQANVSLNGWFIMARGAVSVDNATLNVNATSNWNSMMGRESSLIAKNGANVTIHSERDARLWSIDASGNGTTVSIVAAGDVEVSGSPYDMDTMDLSTGNSIHAYNGASVSLTSTDKMVSANYVIVESGAKLGLNGKTAAIIEGIAEVSGSNSVLEVISEQGKVTLGSSYMGDHVDIRDGAKLTAQAGTTIYSKKLEVTGSGSRAELAAGGDLTAGTLLSQAEMALQVGGIATSDALTADGGTITLEAEFGDLGSLTVQNGGSLQIVLSDMLTSEDILADHGTIVIEAASGETGNIIAKNEGSVDATFRDSLTSEDILADNGTITINTAVQTLRRMRTRSLRGLNFKTARAIENGTITLNCPTGTVTSDALIADGGTIFIHAVAGTLGDVTVQNRGSVIATFDDGLEVSNLTANGEGSELNLTARTIQAQRATVQDGAKLILNAMEDSLLNEVALEQADITMNMEGATLRIERLSAKRWFRIQGTGNLWVNQADCKGDAWISIDGLLTLNKIDVNGKLEASADAMELGDVTAQGDIRLTATTDIFANAIVTQNCADISAGGTICIGSLTAKRNADLTAKKDVLGNRIAAENLTISAGGNVGQAERMLELEVTGKVSIMCEGDAYWINMLTPDEPTPDEPTPDEPTPDEPTPDEPTPDEPTPDEPTPDEPTPDEVQPNHASQHRKTKKKSLRYAESAENWNVVAMKLHAADGRTWIVLLRVNDFGWIEMMGLWPMETKEELSAEEMEARIAEEILKLLSESDLTVAAFCASGMDALESRLYELYPEAIRADCSLMRAINAQEDVELAPCEERSHDMLHRLLEELGDRFLDMAESENADEVLERQIADWNAALNRCAA